MQYYTVLFGVSRALGCLSQMIGLVLLVFHWNAQNLYLLENCVNCAVIFKLNLKITQVHTTTNLIIRYNHIYHKHIPNRSFNNCCTVFSNNNEKKRDLLFCYITKCVN